MTGAQFRACTCAICRCTRAGEVVLVPVGTDTRCPACYHGVHNPHRRPGLAPYLIQRFGWRQDHAEAIAQAVHDFEHPD